MWIAYCQTSDEDICMAIHSSRDGAIELLRREYPDSTERAHIETKQMYGHGSAVMEDESWSIATWED
jgi:hypothetical protein